MKARQVVEIMNNWAKPELIDTWDNTGFQIGDPNKEIKKILISLDLDKKILDIGIRDNYDMIITHHPLIFKPLKSITSLSYKEKMILDIIRNDIIIYNAHSNLDLAEGGVNDKLSEILGLIDTAPLNICSNKEDELNSLYGYGRIGRINEINLYEFIGKIKESLNIANLRVYGEIDKKVSKIAVCGGSGAEFIWDAYNSGADVYITGDIKYHDAQYGHELGLTIIDAGHYDTEKIILPAIKDYIRKEVNEDIYIRVIMESSLPVHIY